MSCAEIVALASFSLLVFVCSPAIADQKCQLTQYASLDLGTDADGGIYVTAEIDGRTEKLLVDTGSFGSTLTSSAAQSLNLAREGTSKWTYMFLHGNRISEIAHADAVQLGAMVARHVGFFVLPDGVYSSEDGSLGPDIMANYDVELDLARSKLNLFSPDHCPGQVVYWTHQPYAQIPVVIDAMGRLQTAVQLDGKSINAFLDTSTSRSTAGFEAMRDLFGWDEKTSSLEVTSRLADGAPSNYLFPFKSLVISGINVSNPDVVLTRQRSEGDFRIGSMKMTFLIGMSVLRQMHMYIAYHEKSVYVTSASAR